MALAPLGASLRIAAIGPSAANGGSVRHLSSSNTAQQKDGLASASHSGGSMAASVTWAATQQKAGWTAAVALGLEPMAPARLTGEPHCPPAPSRQNCYANRLPGNTWPVPIAAGSFNPCCRHAPRARRPGPGILAHVLVSKFEGDRRCGAAQAPKEHRSLSAVPAVANLCPRRGRSGSLDADRLGWPLDRASRAAGLLSLIAAQSSAVRMAGHMARRLAGYFTTAMPTASVLSRGRPPTASPLDGSPENRPPSIWHRPHQRQ